VGCAFLNGIVFGTYGLLMRAQLNHSSDIPTLRQIALAGAGSGMFASYVHSIPFLTSISHLNFARLIASPTELLKIKQQNLAASSPGMPMPTTGQLAWQVWRKQGISGLYRGITTTALRDSAYGVYFCMVRHFRSQDAS
jgi:solute carrier family 25 carnitine/acylcarnitine transporter 20/29